MSSGILHTFLITTNPQNVEAALCGHPWKVYWHRIIPTGLRGGDHDVCWQCRTLHIFSVRSCCKTIARAGGARHEVTRSRGIYELLRKDFEALRNSAVPRTVGFITASYLNVQRKSIGHSIGYENLQCPFVMISTFKSFFCRLDVGSSVGLAFRQKFSG